MVPINIYYDDNCLKESLLTIQNVDDDYILVKNCIITPKYKLYNDNQ